MSGTAFDPDNIDWEPDTIRPGEDPKLAIYPGLDGRLNAEADRQFFEGHDKTDVGVDADAGVLVFEPGGDRQPAAIYREDQAGGDVALKSRVKHLLDDGLEETIHVPLEEQDEFIVANVWGELGDEPTDEVSVDEEPEQEADEDAADHPEEDVEENPDRHDVDEVEDDNTDVAFEPGYTSHADVERGVASKLATHDAVTVTAADIADDVDLTATWVGRTINDLGDSDAPVDVTREHHDDTAETTLYHVTFTGEREPDGPPVLDLGSYTNSLSELRVKNAITGATTVHDIVKELSLPRGEVADILDTLDLLEGLDAGRSPVEKHEVRSALRGVEVRS